MRGNQDDVVTLRQLLLVHSQCQLEVAIVRALHEFILPHGLAAIEEHYVKVAWVKLALCMLW